MKRTLLSSAAALLVLCQTPLYAQSMNKTGDSKQSSPGATGAMGNVGANGVATDPGAVQAQQQGSGKASPGTVGAAPGADTESQNPKK